MTALQTVVKLDIRLLGGLYEVVVWNDALRGWQPLDKFGTFHQASAFRSMLEKMPSLVASQLIRHFA